MNKRIREDIYNKLSGRCAYCGEPIELKVMQIDHVIPQYNYVSHIKNNFRIPAFLTHLTEADMNHKDNLMPTCRVCNKWKNAFDLEQFREEIFLQVDRLNNYNANYRFAKKYGLVSEVKKPIIFYFEELRKENQ